jgi:hypothetical protein
LIEIAFSTERDPIKLKFEKNEENENDNENEYNIFKSLENCKRNSLSYL